VHNLHVYGALVRDAREAVLAGRFAAFARAFVAAQEARGPSVDAP
jgi:queuine tRNA-ribosyltransferase